MADASAREPLGLALTLALELYANSDLVGMKGLLHHPLIRWRAAAAARERAYEGRAYDDFFRPS